ncbi:MAG: glycerol-3-phosphate 1-O-acyltransferase PlsY [Candidatus Saccharimonadales bacterium]
MVIVYSIILILFAYLCGSIPFGKIIGKRNGIDIQSAGSGNIGFANAVRVLGWRAGLYVLIGDVSKGFVPVFIVRSLLNAQPILVICVAVAAIIGHVFPIWLQFRGGKGIATGLGVILAFNLPLALVGVTTYILAFSIFKKSAPSSLTATWVVSLLSLILNQKYSWFYVVLGFVALWTHRQNIRSIMIKEVIE